MCTAVGTVCWMALTYGRCRVAVLAQQHADHLPMLVDRAIQVPLVLAAEEEHLVDVPTLPESSTVLASFGSQLRPEGLDPAQYGPVRHVDAALSEQFHDTRGRQWVAQVPAHRHQDDIGWPAIAREDRGRSNREVPPTASAGEALATMAVMAVTGGHVVLAVRARRHAARRYQQPADYFDRGFPACHLTGKLEAIMRSTTPRAARRNDTWSSTISTATAFGLSPGCTPQP